MWKVILAATACVVVGREAVPGGKPSANASLVARQDPVPAPTPEGPLDCSDIIDLVVIGVDWTDVTKTVCTAWGTYLEAAFGPFPVNSIEGVNNMLQLTFGPDGLFESLQKKYTEKNDNYCLRKEVQRKEEVSALQANTKSCPTTIGQEYLQENPAVVNKEIGAAIALNEGYWSCADAGVPDECNCNRRDPTAAVAPTQRIQTTHTVSAMGCKMVHSGKCYGDCPKGYRSTFLKGWFRPVCTSICVSTNHRVTCGVGCANSRTSCAGVILQQAKEVVLAGSKVVGFLTAGTAGLVLAQTVEQIVKLAEFSFNILSTVFQVLDVAYKMFQREEAELALLLSIYQVIKESAGEIAQDIGEWLGIVDGTTKLFFTLIDSQWQWADLDIGWLTGTLIAQGASILTSGFKVAESFAYAPCEIATDDVAATIEDVGDQRIIGPWTKDGAVNGKGAYRALADRANVIAEWSSRSKSWSIWVMDKTFGRGWWFGWAGFGWREMYESFADEETLPSTGWKRVEGALPLPYIVATGY